MIDYNIEIENIGSWMKDYQKNSGCGGYALGISGGLDSALMTALCLKAVGKGKFIGIYLPCESSPTMEKDSIQLSENLGIELRVTNLIDSYNAIIQKLEESGETVSQLTKANTKARLRMTYLFALANQYDYLVCGTGNRSELNVGYCTVGGDQICSVEPIGNYYKTEIYKMAKMIPQIPKNILEKPASADLWENQTDEQEMGITYERLDLTLRHYHGEFGGYNNYQGDVTQEEFDKVSSMVEKAKFKNNVPPRYSRSQF